MLYAISFSPDGIVRRRLTGPFYVDRDDLENTKGLKTFLGYEETTD